jgi:hypothetical protein
MIRTHTFSGKKYKINTEPIGAYCENPQRPPRHNPEIHFVDGLKNDLTTLEYAIEEGTHALRFLKREDTVRPFSKELGTFLWRLGYRLKK